MHGFVLSLSWGVFSKICYSTCVCICFRLLRSRWKWTVMAVKEELRMPVLLYQVSSFVKYFLTKHDLWRICALNANLIKPCKQICYIIHCLCKVLSTNGMRFIHSRVCIVCMDLVSNYRSCAFYRSIFLFEYSHFTVVMFLTFKVTVVYVFSLSAQK